MYYENEYALFRDLEDGVKDNLLLSGNAFMAMQDRGKSFRVLQYMKKRFPMCEVTRKFNDEVYLISIREKYETV